MDKFTNKNSRQNRPRVSIDGITPDKVHRPPHMGDVGFDGKPEGHRKPHSQPGSRLLDDFKRPENITPTEKIGAEPVKRRPSDHPQAPSTSRLKRLFGKKQQKKPTLDGANRMDKRELRKRRLKIAGVSCAALLLIGVLGFGYLRSIFGGGGGAAALHENVDPSKLRGEGDGRVNILLMGRGGPGSDGPDLTDTMMIVSIDPINNEAGIVSIPRDLYVTVPEFGAMKINQVFYTGKSYVLNNSNDINNDVKRRADEKGYDMAKSAVEDVIGIPIHYRSIIDYKGFKEAVDTVGGVDIDVPKRVYEKMRFDGQPYTLNVKPGQKHFDGFEALAYARSRYTSEGGDFERSERQRLIILALKDKVLSAGTFTNPAKVAGLLDNFGDHVKTDFSLSDLSRLQEIFSKVDSSKIESIDLVDPPHDYLTTSTVGDLSVVLPKAGADNYAKIHKYIRNTLKDGFLKSENANVMVLNGTDRVGLATDKAEELRSYGYNVGTVDNAPGGKKYASTILVDLRDGYKKYTRRYLEQRFGTIAVSGLPDSSIQTGGADFVIILGSDTRH